MVAEKLRLPTNEELGFDPDALREKYRQERDKRLREEGEAQFLTTTGTYAHYADDDPYAPPGFTREPLTDEVEVLIIGGGWAGLITAARAIQAGVTDVRIIEGGADFGGTWYWNRYPGAQCDIESYIYLPLLEETGYIPKLKYSYAPEIFAHAQRIGTHFGLYDHTCFQTRVTELRWDDASARWIVTTNRDDRMRARFVVMAIGVADRPRLPGVPGIDDFEGHTFHTSRWDYEYTGGDHTGDLHKLADKRVAIIGTGATAIQCVPYLGQSAQHLYVFQRTPSSVDERGNKPTDPEWAATLQPGWQRDRVLNFATVSGGQPFEVDLVSDAWTDIFRNLAVFLPREGGPEGSPEDAAALTEIVDFQKMEQIRRRVDETVTDPRIAELLKPWYRQFCKRPTFNDEYLPTFNRPNVTLVDTSASRGVERITRKGVVANGVEYEVDCIIYATGFEIGSSLGRKLAFPVLGPGGRSIVDHWAGGIQTLHGHSTHGFPNLFWMTTNTSPATGFNVTASMDDSARQIAYIISAVMQRGAQRVEPTAEAIAEWLASLNTAGDAATTFLEACTPGYYNGEGRIENATLANNRRAYPGGLAVFADNVTTPWRERGDLQGLTLS